MMFEILLNPYLIAIFAALLPVVLLLFYIYKQDSAQPEPIKWLWKSVWYGVLSAIIVICFLSPVPDLESIYPSLSNTISGAIINAFFYAAIPEEAAKLFMLWLLLRKNPYFDEHLDGIVYATCIGLGFAGLENIFYLIWNLDNFVTIAIIRGLFSVPGHFFFAVAMGYFLSLAHFGISSKFQKNKLRVLAYLIPVIIHGIYDSLLMIADLDNYLSIICMLLFFIFVHKTRLYSIKKISRLKSKTTIT